MRVNNEKGLTLIEVLGAMLLLGIVILGFVQFSHYVSSSNSKFDLRSDALIIAENKLNELRGKAPLNINDLGTSVDGIYTIYVERTSLSPNDAAITVGSLAIPNTETLSLQGVIPFDDNASYLVTVTVGWERAL